MKKNFGPISGKLMKAMKKQNKFGPISEEGNEGDKETTLDLFLKNLLRSMKKTQLD